MPTIKQLPRLRGFEPLEFNFVLSKFRKLSRRDKIRLANAIRDNEESSDEYVNAVGEVFNFAVHATTKELTAYINKEAGGTPFNAYFIQREDIAAKAAAFGAHIKAVLPPKAGTYKLPDFDVSEIKRRARQTV